VKERARAVVIGGGVGGCAVLYWPDLLNANFIDDGERIRIVDWGYAAMDDCFFDLANFATAARAHAFMSDSARRCGASSRQRSQSSTSTSPAMRPSTSSAERTAAEPIFQSALAA
jgi:hypothetical protein